MPLVTIDVRAGRSPAELDALSDSVHEAMRAELGVPERDRFQVLTEHSAATLRFDPGYLDIPRTEGYVLVRITLLEGRAPEVKRAFYARLARELHERAGVRPEDVMVVLVETRLDAWSFGGGEANLLDLPRERWR